MNSEFIQRLRDHLPEYLAQRGSPVTGRNRGKNIRCLNPAHVDHKPSMSYYAKHQKLHCFGCGAKYDIFDLIALDYPDCSSFPLQVAKVCELFGERIPDDVSVSNQAAQRTHEPIVGGGSAQPLSFPAAQRAHPSAAISPTQSTASESGFGSAKLAAEDAPALPPETPADFTALVTQGFAAAGAGGAYFAQRGIPHELCRQLGLFERDGWAWMPIWQQGTCVSYCTRATRAGIEPHYRNSAGPMGLFGVDYLFKQTAASGGFLLVCEAVFDALSAEVCGVPAIALCGVGGVRKLLDACAAHPDTAARYTYLLAGDNDPAGQKMNAALAEGLAALGLVSRALILPEGYKDLNELLIGDQQRLEGLLRGCCMPEDEGYARTSAAYALGELLDLSARRGARLAVSTGIAPLDRALDGGLYSGLYVLGAISSLGKTSLLLQIADHLAGAGEDVLYFSLEMSRVELMAKSLSRITWKQSHALGMTVREVLRLGSDTPANQADNLRKAVEAYRQFAGHLFLREGLADIGGAQIRQAVAEHIRLRGRRPVVMVDYLQILAPEDSRLSDKQNTDRAVVELKRISRDFDLPVFALSSLNRENYRNPVSMEAFKESGAVEYSSDVLLGLQLKGTGLQNFSLAEEKRKIPRTLELVVLKNRSGAAFDKINLLYDPRFGSFLPEQARPNPFV